MKTKFLTILLVILAIFVVSCPSGPELPPAPTPDKPATPTDPVKPTEDVDTAEISPDDVSAWKSVLTSLVKGSFSTSEGIKEERRDYMGLSKDTDEIDIPSKISGGSEEPVANAETNADTIKVKYYKGSYQSANENGGEFTVLGEYVTEKKTFRVDGEAGGDEDNGWAKYYEDGVEYTLNYKEMFSAAKEGTNEYKATLLLEGLSGESGSHFDDVISKTDITYTNYSDNNKINGKATNTTVNNKTNYYVSDSNIMLTIGDASLIVRYNIKATVGDSSEETAENGSYLQVKRESDGKFKNFELTELGFKEVSVSPEA